MTLDQIGIVAVGMFMTGGAMLIAYKAFKLPKPPKCPCDLCREVDGSE